MQHITKIDKSLQNTMMHMRFNNLPKAAIIKYLQAICCAEGIRVSNYHIERIQKKFEYDIRSTINYMQFNFIDVVPTEVSSLDNTHSANSEHDAHRGHNKVRS